MGETTKLNSFYNSLKANPNITGLPDEYGKFAEVMQDPLKSESFYNSLRKNPNILGLPEDYQQFASGLELDSAWEAEWDNVSAIDKVGRGIKKGYLGMKSGLMNLAAEVAPLYSPALPGGGLDREIAEIVMEPLKMQAAGVQQQAEAIKGKGFLFGAGEFLPQTAGSLLAIGASPFTGGSSLSALPTIIGAANITTLTGSVIGNTLMDVDQYAQEKGIEIPESTRWATALLAGTAEFAAEKVRLGRYLPEGFTGKMISGFLKESPEVAEDMMKGWAKARPTMFKKFLQLAKQTRQQGLEEGAEEFFTQIAQDYANYLYLNPDDRFNFSEIIGNAVEAGKGGFMMGAFLGPAGFGANKISTKLRHEREGGMTLMQTKDGKVYEFIGVDAKGNYGLQDAVGNTTMVPKSEVTDKMTMTNDEMGQYLDAYKNAQDMLPQLEQKIKTRNVEDKIHSVGSQLLNVNMQPGDPDAALEFVDTKLGQKISITGSMREGDNIVMVGYDMEKLKAANYDFSQVKREFIKETDVQNRMMVPYMEWFNSEMAEYNATMGQAADVEAAAQSPFQAGQQIDYQGRKWNVAEVNSDGIVVEEIDEEGMPGESRMIGNDELNQIAQKNPQTPTGQPSAEGTAAPKPQARVISDGKNEYTVTPKNGEEGSYLVDKVFETKDEAISIKDKLAKRYPKLSFFANVEESGDDFTPDKWTISAISNRKPKTEEKPQETAPAEPEDITAMSEQEYVDFVNKNQPKGLRPEIRFKQEQEARAKHQAAVAAKAQQPQQEEQPQVETETPAADETAAAETEGQISETPQGETTPEETPEEKQLSEYKQRKAKVLANEPSDFTEAVMHFFVAGGRISSSDFIRYTGYKGKDLATYLQFISKDGARMDTFYEHLQGNFGYDGGMDMINEMIEIMQTFPDRGKMLRALEVRYNFDAQPEPGIEQTATDFGPDVPVDEIAPQVVDSLVDEIMASQELMNIFTFVEWLTDEGKPNWNAIRDTLENDPLSFTSFPLGLNEQEVQNLKKLLDEPQQQRILEERINGSNNDPGQSEGNIPDGSPAADQEGDEPDQPQEGEPAEVTPIDVEVTKANDEVDTEPTEAQKEAGNYKKGHVLIHGMNISIENPVGSIRSGTDRQGNDWSVMMNNSYGYIRGTEGKDGDHLDVFLGDDLASERVFIVDQVDPETLAFDEHKIILGANTKEEAIATYRANYEPSWRGLGGITEVTIDKFKEFAFNKERTQEPYSEEVKEYHRIRQEAGLEPTEEELRQMTPDTEPAELQQAESGNDADAKLEREQEEYEQKKKEEEAKPEPEFGSSNTVFTQDAAAKAREILRKKLNNLNVGVDPEILQAGITLAGYYVEAGARKFNDYAKKMIGDMGDSIRPYLKSFYNAVRDWPGFDTEAMDDYGTVAGIDVNEIGKEEEKKPEKNHRVFIVKTDGTSQEFDNLTEDEAEQKYNELAADKSNEIITWDKAEYNKHGKLSARPTVKITTNKPTAKPKPQFAGDLFSQPQEEQKPEPSPDGLNGPTAQFLIQKHSKTNETLYTVKLIHRISKEQYANFKWNAKRLGGKYSSYNKEGMQPGFLFKNEENAKSFAKNINKVVPSVDEPVETYIRENKVYQQATPKQDWPEGVSYVSERAASNDKAGQLSIWGKGDYNATPDSGNVTYLERILTNRKKLNFIGDPLTGSEIITNSDDVAFLFKNLESAASEHFFTVYVNEKGEYKVLHISSGGTSGTVTDLKLIAAGAKEFGAKKVYLVHNHPSGNMQPSDADMLITNRVRKGLAYMGVEKVEHVIIDLDSGEYGTITNDADYYNIALDKGVYAKSNQTAPVDIYQFDRQKLYVPSKERTLITGSLDAATYLSKMKRGTTPKIHALILDRRNSITKYLLYDESITKETIGKELLAEVGKHGGSVILASNTDFQPEFVRYIKEGLKSMDADILDVLVVKQDDDITKSYKSWADQDLIREPETPYGPNELSDSAVNYRGLKNEVYGKVKEMIDTYKVKDFDPDEFSYWYNKFHSPKNNIYGVAADNPTHLALDIYLKMPDRGIHFRHSDDIYFSPVERALAMIKQDKATAQQWKAMLLKNGAKQAELDWMGFDEFILDISDDPNMTIGGSGKKIIYTKEELQGWIDQNKIEIKEVTFPNNGEPLERIDLATLKDNIKKVERIGESNVYEITYTIGDTEEKTEVHGQSEEEAIDYLYQSLNSPFDNDEAGPNDVKYEKYTLPGGEDYKEVILTLNPKEGTKGIYKSSHWGNIQNPLAHVRFNSRTDADGKNILFIEEVQSDWAQQGKKEGFAGDPVKVVPNVYGNEPGYAAGGLIFASREDAENERGKTGVPDMPFKQTDQWAGLVLRRMIRYAIDNGFDAVAWTPGQVQADRYDLSKQVDSIQYTPGSKTEKFPGVVMVTPKDYIPSREITKRVTNENELADVVGKDIAEKIIAGQHDLKNPDLKIGGEGMKGFYDNILPSIANKIGKRFGSQVERGKIVTGGDYFEKKNSDGWYDIYNTDEELVEQGFVSKEEALHRIDQLDVDNKATIHTLPITPAMFDNFKQGVPLFRNRDLKGDELLDSVFDNENSRKRKETEMRGRIELLAQKLNTPINVVNTKEDLPADLKKEIKRLGAEKDSLAGIWDKKSQQIYLVLSDISSIDEAIRTVIHEVVGHKGMETLLGDEYNDFLLDVYNSMDDEYVSWMAKVNDTENRLIIASEFVAYLSENNIDPSTLEKVVAWIRRQFRKVFKVDYSINDIRDLLRMSRENLENSRMPQGKDFKTAGEYLDAMTAWHGSPYNIRRFRSRKIGTGEGNQMFGYGLYFSDKKEVAEFYARSNAQIGEYLDKARHELGPKEIDWIEKALARNKWDYHDTIMYLQDKMERYIQDPKFANRFKRILDYVSRNPFPENRYLYSVLLGKGKTPDEMDWVDYEKPLKNTQVVKIADQLKKQRIDSPVLDLALWNVTPASKIYELLAKQLGSAKRASSFLSRAGIDGMTFPIGTIQGKQQPGKNYVVFNDKDIDITNRIQFRKPPDPNKPQGPPPNILRKKGEKRTVLWQNRMLAVREWQNRIKGKGGKITDYSNPYRQENLSHGIVKNAIEAYDKKYVNALETAAANIMFNANMDYKELNEYMIAKHAPERNAALQETTKREVNSGMTNDEARDIVDKYESRMTPELISEFWKSVNNATHYTVNRWFADGFISQETHEKIMNQYEYYVPLRGWQESEADSMYEYQQEDVGKTVNPLRRAKGRQSLSDDPLQYIVNMAHTAIVMGEKNRIKQHAARLIRDNKGMEELHRFKKVYAVWDGTMDANGKKNYVEVLERPAQEKWDAGDVLLKFNMSHVKGRGVANYKEHEVEVFIGGEKFVMVLPADVANAVNKTPSKWDNVAFILREWKLGQFTRWLSFNFTSKNPAFIVLNQMRDLQYATLAHFIKGDTQEALDFIKTLPQARRAIIEHIKGKGDPKNKIYQMYLDFMRNGGETGYVHLKDVDQLEAEIQRDLKRLTKTNSTFDKVVHANLLRAMGKWMDNMAIRSENLSRFATYLVAKQQGKSDKEAAFAAKEITVNFNRKGSISSFLGGLYAFFNASIQGGENVIRMSYQHKAKFAAIGAAGMAMGFLTALMNSLWAGDDDDGLNKYDAISDYLKYNNFIFFIPGSDKYITVPLPHGFRWFNALGVLGYQSLYRGSKNLGNTVKDGLSTMFSAISPVNPVEFIKDNEKVSLRPLVPTFAVPFYDVIFNETYTGAQVHKEPFTKALEGRIANSALGMEDVNSGIKGFTDFLFKLGGGNPDIGSKYYMNHEGKIVPVSNIFDKNPSDIEHVIEYYLGGRGTFWNNVIKTSQGVWEAAKETDPSVINANQVPVLRSLLRQPWKTSVYSRYYDIVDDIENYKSMKNMEAKASDNYEASDLYSPEYQYKIDLLSDIRKDLKDLDEDMQYMKDPDQIQEVKDVQERLIRNFIELSTKYEEK